MILGDKIFDGASKRAVEVLSQKDIVLMYTKQTFSFKTKDEINLNSGDLFLSNRKEYTNDVSGLACLKDGDNELVISPTNVESILLGVVKERVSKKGLFYLKDEVVHILNVKENGDVNYVGITGVVFTAPIEIFDIHTNDEINSTNALEVLGVLTDDKIKEIAEDCFNSLLQDLENDYIDEDVLREVEQELEETKEEAREEAKDIIDKFINVKPTHYPNAGENDLIDFALDNKIGALEFNIFKYVLRFKDKNGVEDLLKAKEYINRLIEFHNVQD